MLATLIEGLYGSKLFPWDRNVVYDWTVVTACHNVLAMEIAGLSGSKLYAGSWS